MQKSRLSTSALVDVALAAVHRIRQPLLLYGIAITALIVVVLIRGQDVPAALSPLVYGLIALVSLVATFHFALESYKQYVERGRRRQQTDPSRSGSGSARTCVKRIFDRSDSPEFHELIESLARRSDHMIFIGTGLNVLQRDPLVQEIMERAANQRHRLEIYLANPRSPDIESRLVEEETGEPKPPVGREGLRRRLNGLMGIWRRLGCPDTVDIRLFPNYPTFALIIIGDDYFVYPYGHAKLGNFSPVFHFSRGNAEDEPVVKFLDDQYRSIREVSVDAHQLSCPKPEMNVQALYPFAAYFIPQQTSNLYQFGTEIIGFDIYRHASTQSKWRRYVGTARDFGFHLTVCDALYFASQKDAERAKAEVEFLLKDFRPFELTNTRIVPCFPDRDTIAIGVDDPTGSLEAIHHELVHRVYRRAAASNYSLGLAPLTRDNDNARTRIMIERYLAPYILGRFAPHFTLMTGVDPSRQPAIIQQLDRLFSKARTECVRVERLALMGRPSTGEPWRIEKEVIL